MPREILFIDADALLLRALRKFFSSRGFQVSICDGGPKALVMVNSVRPDVIVCEAELPGLNGFDLCRRVKERKRTADIPVILVSGARKQELDILQGFGSGAEDFVAKPFSFPVLLAKVEVFLRRVRATEDACSHLPALNMNGLELDLPDRSARVNGAPLSLTRNEFKLLATLASLPGRPLTPAQLLEEVWGYDTATYSAPETVRVHISNLRHKLGPRHAKRIVTVIGYGYKFE